MCGYEKLARGYGEGRGLTKRECVIGEWVLVRGVGDVVGVGMVRMRIIYGYRACVYILRRDGYKNGGRMERDWLRRCMHVQDFDRNVG